MSHSKLFDETIVSNIGGTFTATTSTMVYNQIKDIIKSNFLDSLVSQQETYADWLNHYNSTFLIVNPTKEKFSDTLLNKNYYELLRIFSNEL